VAVQTVFTTLDAAREALSMQGLTTFYVIDMKPKADEVDFASDLEILFPAIAALPRGEFAQATRDRILGEILPILVAVLGLAFIVGLAIAGLTIYTATVEKSREYGILKAVGFKNRYLYRVVLEQSLVTGTLGFAIGAGLTLAISPFARDFVPQFVTFVKWQDILLVAGATLVMSGIAAYIPVRRLASIDPVAVFKA
jgi:putative ABC transport system permease protein